MSILTIQAGRRTDPVFAPRNALVKVTPLPGGTASLEYTIGENKTALANAVWTAWPQGSNSTEKWDAVGEPMFVRASAVTKDATLTIDDSPPRYPERLKSDWLGGTPIIVTVSRDLTAGDNRQTLTSTAGSGITLTIPAGLPKGFGCAVIQSGAGQVTLTAGSGVVMNNVSTQSKTSAQYAVVALINDAADSYTLSGSTGA